MTKGQRLKKRHIAILLLIMLVFWGIWQVLHFSPFEETIIKKVKVNSTTTLYVTEGNAGATTSYVYQYYLIPSDKTESEFLENLGDSYSSFLSTADPDVKYEISNSNLRLAVKDNVYHFTNVANTTTIYLTALPF
ncbi:hypothetical protein AAH446_13850 [Erwinia sp. P6884]|uniref:hypothetical protein n=1 Tax=Erwinia sp. P6884 TaxID=3141450 RepID=UPI00319473B1